jgi:diacylglycerol kinase family enzyme
VAGIPLDPDEAARALLQGSPRPIDLLLDGEEIVVNAAHAGLGVAAAGRARGLKGTLGPAAYAAGAVIEDVAADAVELAVEVDGEPVGDGAPLLLVGVGNGSSVGGGTMLFPEADPADGLLDVLTVADRGTWQRLVLGVAAKREEHLDLDGVTYLRGREVVVRGTAAWNDDGELGDPLDGRRLRVEPAAWRLLR